MFLLFAGATDFPQGGWSDFIGAYYSKEDAESSALSWWNGDSEWWHIVFEEQIVAHS